MFSLPLITFGEMKAQLRAVLFVDGEAENCVGLHDKMFVDALIDIQQFVECNQVNNTQVYPFCSTLFQCGMTVITAPRDIIKKVSVFDRLTSRGVEDADSPINWCSEVIYHQVSFEMLARVIDRKLGCSWSAFQPVPVNGGCCGGFAGGLGFYYGKAIGQRYHEPDDADYHCFPQLPFGFHYPQADTDLRRRRARNGVWAVHRGRVYVAPYIQSTETVVMEWDGIKTRWTDDDLVDDDEMLKDCLYFYLKRGHARDVDGDDMAYIKYNNEYCGNAQLNIMGAREKLWLRCREATRVKGQEPSHSRMSLMTIQEQTQGVIEPCTTPTTSTTSTTSSTSTTTCAPPTAPTSFTVTVPLDTQYATLEWVPGSGTQQQEIWRSLDCGDTYTSFAQVASTVTSFIDTSTGAMPAGTCVCYKVRGNSPCGPSAFAAFADNSNCGHIE